MGLGEVKVDISIIEADPIPSHAVELVSYVVRTERKT